MKHEFEDDAVTKNIFWSAELIETLKQTTKVSEDIVQHAKAFLETQRLLENSNFISKVARDQIRGSRRLY